MSERACLLCGCTEVDACVDKSGLCATAAWGLYMCDRCLEPQRTELTVMSYLDRKSEIGLADLKRWVSNLGCGPLASTGTKLARILQRVGWVRDGWLYTGYDRTPRWVRRHVA